MNISISVLQDIWTYEQNVEQYRTLVTCKLQSNKRQFGGLPTSNLYQKVARLAKSPIIQTHYAHFTLYPTSEINPPYILLPKDRK